MVRVHEPVVRSIRLAEHRESAGVLAPWEFATVDDDPAHRRSVTSQEFRQRVNYNIGTVVERAQQNRRGDRVVDDQGNAVLVGCFCQRFEVANVPGGISYAFAEERPCIVIYQLLHRGWIIALGKSNVDPQLGQDVREQGVRGSVELRDGDDVVAVRRYVKNGVVKGRLAAAYAERSHSAFKQRDPPFEHVAGRVADSAVAVPLDFEVEQSRPVLSAVEGVGNGLIDGYGDRPGRRIDFVATVDGKRFVTQIPRRDSHVFAERAA